MSILTGHEIVRQVNNAAISIQPFNLAQVNPVSVDLRLGKRVATYQSDDRGHVIMDSKEANNVNYFDIPEAGIVLQPGTLYLMHTLESVHTNDFVAVLDGKSSLGRLGIKVHETAGYIDPGFDGHVTLEVTSMHYVRVYAGMRFCQIRFHTMEGFVSLYGSTNGHYVGERADGPVPSMSWKQFQEDVDSKR